MPISKIACALVAAAAAITAQPLPSLRTEAVPGGSVFYVKNTGSQPLATDLIELVDYPGSSYFLFDDNVAKPIAPGSEKRIPVANMTVGAAPEYVKITAAVFADGGTAGDAAKVAIILGRRKAILETTGELIARLEKAQDKAALIADLKQWADSRPQPKSRRLSAEVVNAAVARETILQAVARLERGSVEEVLGNLRSGSR